MPLKFVRRNSALILFPTDAESEEFVRNKAEGEECWLNEVKSRNISIHNAYFAFITLAFNNLPENCAAFYPNKDRFREAMQIAAGHYNLLHVFVDGEWLEYRTPKSIDFKTVPDDEFTALSGKVKEQIFQLFEREGLWDKTTIAAVFGDRA